MAELGVQVILVDELYEDLSDEHRGLYEIVEHLDPSDWDLSTEAPGWRIREQIAHLAFVDSRAALAVSDPPGFVEARGRDRAAPGGFESRSLSWAQGLQPEALLAAWSAAHQDFLRAASSAPAEARVPWYGPSMNVASKVTARLMETWAHGQDVVDALGVHRKPTARLRHIAFLGVKAREFSFAIRGMTPTEGDVRVELDGPSGEQWSFGEVSASDRINGSALDFCLVVTQRRHLDDTGLAVCGDLARRWMAVAQAYAGKPGPGRLPRAQAADFG